MDKSLDISERGRFELVFELSNMEMDVLNEFLNNVKIIRGQHPDADVTVRALY